WMLRCGRTRISRSGVRITWCGARSTGAECSGIGWKSDSRRSSPKGDMVDGGGNHARPLALAGGGGPAVRGAPNCCYRSMKGSGSPGISRGEGVKPALDALDDWPVSTAAAAVVGPSGVLASRGDSKQEFALASVTKPLVARAVQIAIEEGAVDLDTGAGPPGSTVRHLLAHASGLAMHSDHTLAKPGTRRLYSNYGFTVLAETVQQASGIEFGHYLAEAVFEPLGMTATRLDGGSQAAGFGVTSTVADLAAFAADLLCPETVSAQMH